MDKDIVASVTNQARRLIDEANYGAQTTAGILNAAALLQASKEITSVLADLTLTLSMLSVSLGYATRIKTGG